MTTRRRSRRFSSRSVPRRITAWFADGSLPATVIANGFAIFDMLDPLFLPAGYESGTTVQRMLGGVSIIQDVDGSEVFGAYGIAVMPRDMLAAAVIPDPLADKLDWYINQSFYQNQETERHSVRYPFDIHTARRIRGEDRTLAFIFHNNGLSASVRMRFDQRLLLARS